jgi:hypothetical protein
MKKLILSAALITAMGCSDDGPGEPDARLDGTEISMTLSSAGKVGKAHVAFVAYQDGDGAWQAMTGTKGVYKARVQSGRYGIAIGCTSFRRFHGGPLTPSIEIQHWAIAEKTSLTDEGCFEVARPRTITGTIIGNSALTTKTVEALDSAGDPVSNNYYSINLPAGKTDVFALGDNFVHDVTKLVRLRDVDPVTASPLAINLDAGVSPVTTPVTVPPGSNLIESVLRTKEGAFRWNWKTVQQPYAYYAPPSSMLREGDLIRVIGHRYTYEFVERSSVYLDAPAPIALVFAPLFQSSAPKVMQGSNVSLTFEFTPVAPVLAISSYTVTANAGVIDETGPCLHRATFSSGWIGSITPVSYSFPDLSSIRGWVRSMVIKPRKQIPWEVERSETNTEQYVAGRLLRTQSYIGVTGEYCGNNRIEPAFEQCDPPNGTTCSAACQTVVMQ